LFSLLLLFLKLTRGYLNHGPILHLMIERAWLLRVINFLIMRPFGLILIAALKDLLRAHSGRSKLIRFEVILSYHLLPLLWSDSSYLEFDFKFDIILVLPKTIHMHLDSRSFVHRALSYDSLEFLRDC